MLSNCPGYMGMLAFVLSLYLPLSPYQLSFSSLSPCLSPAVQLSQIESQWKKNILSELHSYFVCVANYLHSSGSAKSQRTYWCWCQCSSALPQHLQVFSAFMCSCVQQLQVFSSFMCSCVHVFITFRCSAAS